jgi:hypothetical protein
LARVLAALALVSLFPMLLMVVNSYLVTGRTDKSYLVVGESFVATYASEVLGFTTRLAFKNCKLKCKTYFTNVLIGVIVSS